MNESQRQVRAVVIQSLRDRACVPETISVRSSSLLLNRRKALISRSRMWWPGLCSLLVGCQ